MFYFSYAGNKRNELKEIDELLSKIKYKKVVEPFGGSLAFSIDQYYKNKDLEFYPSDIDNELTLFCNNFYKHDDNIIKKLLEIIKNISNKEDYDKLYKKSISKIQEENIEDFMTYYLFKKTCYAIRPGLYYLDRSPKLTNVLKYKNKLNEFFKDHKYNNIHYKSVFKQFYNDEDAIIFLDPPYVNSVCSFYDKFDETDFSNLWEDIYDMLENAKCKIILIVNDNFFMKKCYHKWFYKQYEKKYCFHSSKKTYHNIFTNIKLD